MLRGATFSTAKAPNVTMRTTANGQGSSVEQRQQLLARDPRGLIGVAERHVGDATLLLLEREDALFDGVLRDHAVHHHGPVLADAVGAARGPIFARGVPPRVGEEGV